jgi:hypothetical protein
VAGARRRLGLERRAQVGCGVGAARDEEAVGERAQPYEAYHEALGGGLAARRQRRAARVVSHADDGDGAKKVHGRDEARGARRGSGAAIEATDGVDARRRPRRRRRLERPRAAA